MSSYAEVVFGLPLNQTFTYLVPEGCKPQVKVGVRVLVPFRRSRLTGYVVALKKRTTSPTYELKEILEVLDDEPVFSRNFLAFTRKLSRHFFSSWGEMLQAALPPSYVLKSRTTYSLSEQGKSALKDEELGGSEKKVLGLLAKGSYTRAFLKRKTGIDNLPSLLSRLEKKGQIKIGREVRKKVRRPERAEQLPPVQLEMDFSLDEESVKASARISKQLGKESFSPHYLYAPLEKREAIYFDLIKKTLGLRKRVLFLVPEISLTQAVEEKFRKRLGENVALLHSELTERKRESEWRRIKEGRADVVVGTRSAVFSPLEDMGLVIVDEEHDESYIQRESPGYDARKGAWIRARTESCLLVYGSSIPSVEAFYQARKRGYVLRLQGRGPVEKAEILEARAEESVFSQKLVRMIEKNLKKRNRVLLFFNRRGYASYLICSRCRFIPRCVRCDVALRYHKKEGKLICHYCGHSALKLDACPNCGSRLRLGRTFGIEVIEEELLRKFPESRVVCFDSDAVKSKKDQERILSRFGKKRIDILIGTQLLAHQKNLSPVLLVVGMYPEGLLTLPDYRASQKTFQILCQMRRFLSKDQSSQLVIQTSVPDQYSIRSAARGDYLSFFRKEVKNRRMMNYPPFSHAVEILFQSGNMRSLARETRKFTSLAKSSGQKIDIFGPAFASVARVRGKFRVQVILKAKRRKNLEAVLRESLSQVKCKKSVFFFD